MVFFSFLIIIKNNIYNEKKKKKKKKKNKNDNTYSNINDSEDFRLMLIWDKGVIKNYILKIYKN